MLTLGIVVVDTVVGHYIHHHGDVLVVSQVITMTGVGTTLCTTTAHSTLVMGIAIAMHGVATYAHTYMGYEQYCCSAIDTTATN